VQRAAKRNAARKLFVSGIPFGADAAGKLAAFFGEHGVEGLSRVAPLKSGQGSGRFSGQAYVEFELVEQAVRRLGRRRGLETGPPSAAFDASCRSRRWL
jgi:hypothetical protein